MRFYKVTPPIFCQCIFLLLTLFLSKEVSAQSPQKKVILISIDGTPDYLIDKFLLSGILPPNGAFAKMKKFGAYAETVLPVNVASTGPSHISIFTGASPNNTGVIGNSFRNVHQSWTSPALSAFKQPIAVETIFQAAMRQGKKVMALGGVGLDNRSEERRTDYMLMYPDISGPSLVMDLVLTDTLIRNDKGENFRKLIADSKSHSKPTFEVTGDFKMPLHIYLTDTIIHASNNKQLLSQIVIDMDTDLDNGYAASVTVNAWATMALNKNGKQYNTSFRMLKMDEVKGKYRFFMAAPAAVFGYPSNFLKKIQSTAGLWPGEPENRKQTTGLVPEEVWFEQIDRLAKHAKDLIISGIKTSEWDLLFGYFSTLDDVQHRYTLTDPRQLDYTADGGARPKIYAGYIEKWFQTIDRYLLEIMNAAPKETNFVIFSDHGMIPIHTTLLLNNYFEHEGFNFSKAELRSISSGSSAHIYINREKINADVYPTYLTQLRNKLKSLKDPVTSEPIFELVANHDEQKKYGLYHKDYSGDLFVSCKAGFSISDRFLLEVKHFVQNSFDPAMFQNQNQATKNFLLTGTMNETGLGVHGNLGTSRAGQSIFYAIGPDVPTKEFKKVSALQIAPTVSKLLGIQAPAHAEGKSVF